MDAINGGNNNRNSRHANLQALGINHETRQQLDNTGSDDDGLIACRVCGNILTNRSALLVHAERHLQLDEDGARLQIFLSHLNPVQRVLYDNLLTQNRDLPSEMNPFFVRTNALQLASASTPRPNISLSLGNNGGPMAPPLRVTQQPTASASAIDSQISFVPVVRVPQHNLNSLYFTRPFLHQVEATMIVEGMRTMIDRAMAERFGDDQPISSDIDLTLKLGSGKR